MNNIYLKISILFVLLSGLFHNSLTAQETLNLTFPEIQYNDDLLAKIRLEANTIQGEKATEIRYIKFAESPRTFAQTVEGGTDEPYIQARTAYQIVFPHSTIMLDAGMDEEVHEFFGNGKKQPYFPSANDSVQQALRQAVKILITHEHGDHVAGVLRTKYFDEIAPKTILTYQMLNTLVNKPQMPQLKTDIEKVKNFVTVDFYDVLPVAPGIVLIKAPGHTPGEIMVYTQFENGKEYIFTGDVSWSYVGIEERKQKPASQVKRIGEDAVRIQYQLDWLNQLPSKGVQLIVSHDDIIQPQLIKKGIMKKGFILR
ncbi:MBL fold metallo-hydrolase [Pedobacter sp. BS3]|uniref:MBL fold metallo-hydrolase n=1 Tax=Pedobacter sp. BS3 TaxID=2567937 RepID=UPI0011EF67C5|nr:MBL fold metallo-hydrolase [Pedobacter sp. BS3]TZF83555.1 MBL fold metallo-hydrolase [Pedobacter sp. BS3]